MRGFTYRESKHKRVDDNIIGKYNNEFNGYIKNKDGQIGADYNFQDNGGELPKYNFYVSPNHSNFGITNDVYSDIPYWYNFNKLSKGIPEYFSNGENNVHCDCRIYVSVVVICIFVLLMLVIIIYKFIHD